MDKIDIFVGYIAENPKKGALVGETAACVLGKQFHNLKYGDRYWYENTERKGSLTKGGPTDVKPQNNNYYF